MTKRIGLVLESISYRIFQTRGRLFAVVFVFILVASGEAISQDAFFDVRKLMTVAEFKSAGLDKLSSSEIAALNQWVGKFAFQVSNSKDRPVQVNRSSVDCKDVI